MNDDKKITNYLEKKTQTRLVQAFIDITLFENVRVILKKNKIKIKSLIEAAFRQYISENQDSNGTKK